MATKKPNSDGVRKARGPGKVTAAGPDFLSASALAKKLGVAKSQTLDAWIAAGRFPPPWAYTGPSRRVWRMDHYKVFVATGAWPEEAWRRKA